MLTTAGNVSAQINFYNSFGERVSAFSFIIKVQKSAVEDGDIVSSEYYNALTETLKAAIQTMSIADEADRAENAADRAEDAANRLTETTIPTLVGDWLSSNITNPTNPVIDESLSISGAAGDAKSVGNFKAEFDSAIETNIIANLSGRTFKPDPHGTWANIGTVFPLPSGLKFISVHLGQITYDVETITSIQVRVAQLQGTTQLSYIDIKSNSDTNIAVNTQATHIRIDVYVNNASAVNTSATVSELIVYGTDASEFNVTLLDTVRTSFAESNALAYYKNRVFLRSTAGTWSSMEKVVDIPANTDNLLIYLGNIVYNGTALTNNFVQYQWAADGTAIGSNLYLNRLNETYNLLPPSNANQIILRFMFNLSPTSNNTQITISEFYVLADDTSIHTQIKESVFLGRRQLSEYSGIVRDIDSSKNLFVSEFKQGSVNSSGDFVPSTSVQFTATKKWIPVKPNTEYTFSWKMNQLYVVLNIYGYTEDGTFLSDYEARDAWANRIRQLRFKTRPTTRYIRIQFWSNESTAYSQIVPEDAQLEIGGAATTYESTFDISKAVDYEKVRDPRLQIPDYYFEGGYLENKVSSIRELMFNASGWYDAFFFITDFHYEWNQLHSPALIRYLAKRLNIVRLFNGGDMHNDWNAYYDDEALQLIRSGFDGKIYNVVGNHEYKGTYMTDPAVWTILNSMHDDIVIGDAGRSYYYVDNKAQKNRYIILNAYTDGGDQPSVYFEQSQQNWLRDTALNLEAGWGAIIFIHAIYEIGNATNPVRWKINGVTDELCSIVDSYSGNGEIIAIIAGHAHRDKITSTPNGVPIIITACDKNGIYYVTEDDPDILIPRESGTKEEQAFDVFVVDKGNRVISAVRIGAPAYNGVDDQLGELVEIRQVNFKST